MSEPVTKRGVSRPSCLLPPLVSCLLLLATCTGDYNPFADNSNARAVVMETTFADGDTVAIFTTQTITVGAAVAERIDSFVLSAPKNRYWTDTTVAAPSGGTYTFRISFHDTGRQSVAVTTYRQSGDLSTVELRAWARSPLTEDTLIVPLGVPCSLTTAAVGDRDVLYHWQLGRVLGAPQVFSSSLPWTVVQPKPYDGHTGAVELTTGFIWVSDAAQRLFSPAAPFVFGFYDNAGPEVICLNDSLRGDTVVTGDSVLVFRVRIEDPSGIGRSPQIDGGDFDNVKQYTGNYRHVYRRMDQYPTPAARAVVVGSWDRTGNASVDTFYLTFSSGGPRSEGASITMLNPRSNPAHTSVRAMSVVTRIDNATDGTVVVRASLNGTNLAGINAFSTSEDTVSWNVTLADGANEIAVMVDDSAGTRRAGAVVSVVYSATAVDTAAPFIYQVRVNEVVAPGNDAAYVRDSVVTVEVVAFDEGSGIDSVTVDGKRASNAGAAYLWRLQGVSVDHPYDALVVRAVDVEGNATVRAVSVVRNRLPRLESGWEWPARYVVGNSYGDTLRAWDSDKDAVTCELVTGAPSGMRLTPVGFNEWVLTWVPLAADSGQSTVLVRLSDAYDDSLSIWTFWTTGIALAPVRFMTTEADFPAWMQAGHDILNQSLLVDPSSGVPPFQYGARITSGAGRVLLNGSASTLTWSPNTADTGRAQFVVTVTDKRGDADTLYPAILVVPRNEHACSLSYTFTGTITDSGLDMRTSLSAQTARFTVHDADHPLTEEHRATVTRSGATTVHRLDTSGILDVVLEPYARGVNDTLTVTVSDRTGTADTVSLRVLYGLSSADQVDNLDMWYDAGVGVTVETGGVRYWGDRTLNAFVLHGDNTALRPDYVEDVINGHPVLRFDGIDNNLHSQGVAGDEWELGAFTVFLVARLSEVVSARRYTLLSSGRDRGTDLGVTCTGRMGMFVEESYNGCLGGSETLSSNLAVQADTWYVFMYRSQAGVSGGKLTVDVQLSGRKATTSLTMNPASAGGDMVLGAGQLDTWSGAWKGDIAEFVWYDRALTDSEVLSVNEFLGVKYGLTIER